METPGAKDLGLEKIEQSALLSAVAKSHSCDCRHGRHWADQGATVHVGHIPVFVLGRRKSSPAGICVKTSQEVTSNAHGYYLIPGFAVGGV